MNLENELQAAKLRRLEREPNKLIQKLIIEETAKLYSNPTETKQLLNILKQKQ
jgi:hypothetical protein